MNRVFIYLSILISVFFAFGSSYAAEKTIGVVLSADVPFYREIHKALTEELSKSGIKAEILLQTPSPETVAWSNAVRKLIAVNVDAIVTYGAPVTIAAVSEPTNIPIVFAGVFDPEDIGVLRKKNATGVSSKVALAGLIKIFKEIANFQALGIVYNSAEKDTVDQAEEVEGLGGKFGYKAVKFNVRKIGDASRITDVDALFITTSCAAQQCAADVLGTARRHKLPTATAISGSEERGVVLTISADPHEQGREAADILIKIMSGKKPSELPIRPAKKVNMVINLKEATELGLKVPFDILSSATRVIK